MKLASGFRFSLFFFLSFLVARSDLSLIVLTVSSGLDDISELIHTSIGIAVTIELLIPSTLIDVLVLRLNHLVTFDEVDNAIVATVLELRVRHTYIHKKLVGTGDPVVILFHSAQLHEPTTVINLPKHVDCNVWRHWSLSIHSNTLGTLLYCPCVEGCI